MHSEINDSLLIEMFKSSDSKNFAFNQIVLKYQERVYWHIRKMVINHDDADDLIQESFIKVWNSLDRFRGESSLYTWIYRIATNEVLAFLKKQKSINHISLQDMENNLRDTLKQDIYFNGDDAQITLYQALASLPPKQRLVFNMKYFDDMKYEEIAEILNTSVGALKASYHIATEKIKKYVNSI
ncbi:MAG: sigma-70 family RNA polymerase sigma factor [Prevotellaceae bacterium]|jgi:RNA polymerase sigma-70 factor (ECF subfamily)|nr:sigma-70 family RNA polymerase sigma factor [Prevotellaceae bacterium]